MSATRTLSTLGGTLRWLDFGLGPVLLAGCLVTLASVTALFDPSGLQPAASFRETGALLTIALLPLSASRGHAAAVRLLASLGSSSSSPLPFRHEDPRALEPVRGSDRVHDQQGEKPERKKVEAEVTDSHSGPRSLSPGPIAGHGVHAEGRAPTRSAGARVIAARLLEVLRAAPGAGAEAALLVILASPSLAAGWEWGGTRDDVLRLVAALTWAAAASYILGVLWGLSGTTAYAGIALAVASTAIVLWPVSLGWSGRVIARFPRPELDPRLVLTILFTSGTSALVGVSRTRTRTPAP